jgi:zinc transporter ZupT
MSATTPHSNRTRAIGACAALVVAAVAVAVIAGEGAAVLAAAGGLACAAMMVMMVWMMLAPLIRRGSTRADRPAEPEAAPAPTSAREVIT